MQGNANVVVLASDVVVHEACYCGGFKPVKKKLAANLP